MRDASSGTKTPLVANLRDAGFKFEAQHNGRKFDAQQFSGRHGYELEAFICSISLLKGNPHPCIIEPTNIQFFYHGVQLHTHNQPNDVVGYDGFADLEIRILEQNSKLRRIVRTFAHAWEAKSKQLKGSREAKVIVYTDYE